MFRHLTTSLTLLALGWTDESTPQGKEPASKRTTRHRRHSIDGTGSASPPARTDRPDRGDVPGWVLITLMTAGLVVALWALAGEAFTTMFEDAMNKVRGAG